MVTLAARGLSRTPGTTTLSAVISRVISRRRCRSRSFKASRFDLCSSAALLKPAFLTCMPTRRFDDEPRTDDNIPVDDDGRDFDDEHRVDDVLEAINKRDDDEHEADDDGNAELRRSGDQTSLNLVSLLGSLACL